MKYLILSFELFNMDTLFKFEFQLLGFGFYITISEYMKVLCGICTPWKLYTFSK